MNIEIAMSVCSRPEYTARVIAGIIGMKGFGDMEKINISIDRLSDGTYHQGVESVLSYFGIDQGVETVLSYFGIEPIRSKEKKWVQRECQTGINGCLE